MMPPLKATGARQCGRFNKRLLVVVNFCDLLSAALQMFRLICVWAPFLLALYVFQVEQYEWAHPVQQDVVQYIGLGVIALCSVAFVGVHCDLGDSWSAVPEVKESHSLVTTGLYRFARHPVSITMLGSG